MFRLLAVCAALALTAAPALAQDAPGHAAESHAHADFRSGRFHVRIDGPEHPVGDIILIPGLTSSPEIWDGLTDQLKDRYRVHRVHIQGFAGAPAMDNAQGLVSAPVADDLARYIQEQHLDHPIVIGHSMGGTIGLMLAARHSDSLGRLMVVDMVPNLGLAMAGPMADRAQIVAAAQRAHDGIAAEEGQARIDSANQTLSGMIRTEARRAGPIQDSLNSDKDVVARSMQELIVTDLTPELSRITVPTEVVYVAFDYPGMSPSMTDAIYRGAYRDLANVKLKRIDDSAHFVMLDQPQAFAEEVEAFVR